MTNKYRTSINNSYDNSLSIYQNNKYDLVVNNTYDILQFTVNNYQILIDLHPAEIVNLISKNGLRRIIDESYVEKIPLSTYIYESSAEESQVRYNNKKSKLRRITGVENPKVLISDLDIKETYIKKTLDPRKKPFFDPEFFFLNKDGSRIVSKDFRVLVDTHGGIPKHVLMHVCTVASLMLCNVVSYPIGQEYIIKFMSKYGLAEFEYGFSGCLHINLRDPKGFDNNMKSKSFVNIKGLPK